MSCNLLFLIANKSDLYLIDKRLNSALHKPRIRATEDRDNLIPQRISILEPQFCLDSPLMSRTRCGLCQRFFSLFRGLVFKNARKSLRPLVLSNRVVSWGQGWFAQQHGGLCASP